MEYLEYKDIAYNIRQNLYTDINGLIKTVVFDKKDCINISIDFKEFHFEDVIVGIEDKVYSGVSVADMCDEIRKEYKRHIMKAFFKSDFKKKKEVEISLGLGDYK